MSSGRGAGEGNAADRPFPSPITHHLSPAFLALLAVGLFTRPVAFVLSGLMAAAYFIAHAPPSFFPVLNGGDAAILYCFVFLLYRVRRSRAL